MILSLIRSSRCFIVPLLPALREVQVEVDLAEAVWEVDLEEEVVVVGRIMDEVQFVWDPIDEVAPAPF